MSDLYLVNEDFIFFSESLHKFVSTKLCLYLAIKSEVLTSITDDYKNNPQTLLFSATMPEWARKTSQKYLKPDCKKIDLMKDDDNQTSKTVQVRWSW